MLRAVSLHLLLGPIKAAGLYSLGIQKALTAHCEAGRIVEVAEVVARALYDQALVDRTIPEPKGVNTNALSARMADAAKHLAETYARRGVLCAKGYYPASQLMLLIIKLWESEFHSVLLNHTLDSGVVEEADPDYITRCTVASQKMLTMLERLPRNEDGDLMLPMKEVEGFCMMAVRTMHAAFVKPDVAVHELMHGETPEEEP